MFKEVPARVEAATRMLLKGDPGPFLDLYSAGDDVTLFGAEGGRFQGHDAVRRQLELLARSATAELVDLTILASHAGQDIGYTVGTQRTRRGDGRGAMLRVTQIYRFEDGDWRLVHRHGDLNAEVDMSGIAAGRQGSAEP